MTDSEGKSACCVSLESWVQSLEPIVEGEIQFQKLSSDLNTHAVVYAPAPPTHTHIHTTYTYMHMYTCNNNE